MTDVETKKALETKESQEILPLILEIMPGHAAEGLIDVYTPGATTEERCANYARGP